MAEGGAYDAAFYAAQRDGSLRSARIVVPRLLTLFPVRSVADVGCGVGTWARAFLEAGVPAVSGFDGDYVDPALLQIPPERFHGVDLRGDFAPGARFDLAVSLEVAEHLPPEHARGFVRRLTEAAPVVLFSAAVPGQGGTEHLNEMWQDAWRALFAAFGYRPVDCLRPTLWGDPAVEFWYQQNMLVYCDAATLRGRPDLSPVPDAVSLDVVHPILYGLARATA